MVDRLILAFCQPCQELFAPWQEACPACAGGIVAVWVTDARPELIAAIAEQTKDGSILQVCLDDDAANLVLIAELFMRAAARAA